MRNGTPVVFALTAAIFGAAIAAGSGAAESGVKAGYLKCDVEGNVSFVFGSSRDVNCTYTPDGKGRVDRYTRHDRQVRRGYRLSRERRHSLGRCRSDR